MYELEALEQRYRNRSDKGVWMYLRLGACCALS